jgi:hypothetical protein
MRRYWPITLLLPVLFLLAPAVRAGDKAAPPGIVVRVQSLDALLQNLNLVVKLVGQEEAAKQIEGLVKSKIGAKGLEGIDPARPFGAYVRFGKALDDVRGAFIVPMADQKTFLGLLENLNLEVKKDKDGIYTYKTNQNIDVYFRFANKYLFITTVNPESIQDKNLVDPAVALALPGNAMISFVARVDQVSNDVKAIALTQMEQTYRDIQKTAPAGETKAQEEFRLAMLRDAHKLFADVIRDAGDIRFDLDVNAKTKELTVDASIAGKPGSDLAKTIKALGDMKSPLTGIIKKDAAFQGSFHLALPDSLRDALGKVIDEASKKSVDDIEDAGKKKQALALFQALSPSAKAGEFQMVAAAVGPTNQQYTLVAAVKLKDGGELGKTIRGLIEDAIKDLPPEQKAKIQLDADSAGAAKIHKFQLPSDKSTDALIKLTGDNHVYLAFREDALFLAVGKEALTTLKTAAGQTKSVASAPFVFHFDIARMAGLMAQTKEQRDLAVTLFSAGQSGRVSLTVEGGSALTARLQMQLSVLEFLVKMKEK